MDILKQIENELVEVKSFPYFKSGYTVTVSYKIKEGAKERIQQFQGVVLQRRGSGATETFTVRKMSGNIGVERIFPMASPFLDGKTTGYHSTRWGLFPQTPDHVPLFASHAHHIQWVNEQLAAGTMQNVRHLWVSVRPNGDRRPYDLNRLELRICDLVTDPIALLAMTALLEARLIQIIDNPTIDPLTQSLFSPEELITLTMKNEMAAATDSLDAKLQRWQDGSTILARDWIAEIYQDVWSIAKQQGFSCFLSPLQKILREGNEAQQWLQLHKVGVDIQRVMTQAILATQERETELESKLCSSIAFPG